MTEDAVDLVDSTNGQLKTKAPLDYETKSTYTVTVSVRDSKAADGTADTTEDASITVTVNVSNVGEVGTVTLFPRQPQVATEFTATLDDPDVILPTITWAWEKSTDKAIWTTVTGASQNAYTPVDEDVGGYLQATASYTDDNSACRSAKAASEFAVRTTPQGNSGPEFANETATRTIVEGSGVGRPIGAPVTATDTDTDDEDKLTYTSSRTDAASFDIVASSGQLHRPRHPWSMQRRAVMK